MISHKQQTELLQLARHTITATLMKKNTAPTEKIEPSFQTKSGIFVTLTRHKELRGCIGCLEARQSIWNGVRAYAIHAAFEDPRFLPVTAQELDQLKIEISILSKPTPLHFSSPLDLIQKLNHTKPGVVLSKGHRSATFLPSVWDELPVAEEFLSHLCLKAGLHLTAWKEPDIEIKTYECERFSEKDP